MNLMREPAGRDNRHIDIFREAFNCPAQRLAESVTTARARYRKLQHADL